MPTTQKKPVLIAYNDGQEVLICKPSDEKKVIKEWFDPSTGRDIDNYDREECTDTCFQIRVNMSVISG